MSLGIDDVNYLKTTGNFEAYLSVIDSAKRDKSLWPKPNMYEASFTQPFPSTFSISLIGARIPRTQYLVNETNNVLTYKVGDMEEYVVVPIVPGDYTIDDLVAVLNQTLQGVAVAVVPFQKRLVFASEQPFCFDMTLSSMRTVIGFGDPVDEGATGYTTLADYVPGPETQPQSHDVFVSLMGADGSYQLAAPGVYDLTGVRYVTIECKELTSHLFRSRAYDRWTANLGLVDLGVYGYQNQSFDYSSYPPREFHPFTLRKLTLAFRCPDGSLYDFKGIDHLLTFVIRYYKPPQDVGQLSMLNRRYDPDPNRTWLGEQEQERGRQQDMVRRGVLH